MERIRVSGFGFRVPDCVFGVASLLPVLINTFCLSRSIMWSAPREARSRWDSQPNFGWEGFRFQVSGFGCGFQISSFGLRVPDCSFGVANFDLEKREADRAVARHPLRDRVPPPLRQSVRGGKFIPKRVRTRYPLLKNNCLEGGIDFWRPLLGLWRGRSFKF